MINDFPLTYEGLTGSEAGIQFQKDLYATIRANPELNGVPVYDLTEDGWGSGAYAPLGDLSAYADYGNVHAYAREDNPSFAPNEQPGLALAYALDTDKSTNPGLPTVITETGYKSAPTWNGVNMDVQAKYEVDMLLDAAKAGVVKTFLYELLDDVPDPGYTWGENHWGLFDGYGNAKPTAVAIHNLTTLLQDGSTSASSFSTGTLSYTLSGGDSTASSYLMEKSTGTFDLAVWAEPSIWQNHAQVAAPEQQVTVSLGTYASIKVYDVMQGTTPISSSVGNTVTLGITDHALVVEVTPIPVPAPVPVVVPTPTPTPIIIPTPTPTPTPVLTPTPVPTPTPTPTPVPVTTSPTQDVPTTTPVPIVVSTTTTPSPGSLEIGSALGQPFGVGTISSGSASWTPDQTGLGGGFTQSVREDGVDAISAATSGPAQSAKLHDVAGGSYALKGFSQVDASLAGAQKGTLLVEGAGGGTVSLDGGNYSAILNAGTGIAGSNSFSVSTGTGSHVAVLNGQDKQTTGTFTLGSGDAVLHGTQGGNSFSIGSGSALIWGSRNMADSYAYHAGGGVANLQTFSSAKGDTLSVDASLRAGMTMHEGGGWTTLMFGGASHEVIVHGVDSFDPSSIRWI